MERGLWTGMPKGLVEGIWSLSPTTLESVKDILIFCYTAHWHLVGAAPSRPHCRKDHIVVSPVFHTLLVPHGEIPASITPKAFEKTGYKHKSLPQLLRSACKCNQCQTASLHSILKIRKAPGPAYKRLTHLPDIHCLLKRPRACRDKMYFQQADKMTFPCPSLQLHNHT